MRKRPRTEASVRVGGAIKRLRDEHGWSQTQLAQKAGVTRSWVSLTELGLIGESSAVTLIKVAKAFRLPLSEFWHRIGYQPQELLKVRIEEFAPDVVEVALRLQALPPESRDSTALAFLQIVTQIEFKEGIRPYQEEAQSAEGG